MSLFGSGPEARRSPGDQAKVTPEIAAEAAVWITVLHGPDRDRAMEDSFREWQQRSPAHREAFEKTTDVWEAIPRSKGAREFMLAKELREADPPRQRSSRLRWVAPVYALVLALGGAWSFQQWREQGVYVTAVGELRSILLDDGSRVLLNTDTNVRVDFDAKRRSVEIRGGEALFEVVKDPGRPFVVRVGGSEVIAVGTAFSVRFVDGPKQEDALTVMLIEGQVNVRPTAGRADALAPKEAVTLKPGDRLTLDYRPSANVSALESKLDRPDIERAMAWKRNELAFKDTPLVDAIEEINRYSRTQITWSDEVELAKLDVSGVFKTGDSAAFANAVAMLHGLKVREVDGRLRLEKIG